MCAVGPEKEKEEVRLMRRIILLMTVAALVVASALGGVVVSAAGAPQHPTKKVLIKNFSFKPAKVTIERGTRVIWINKDTSPHTATANNGRSFDSGRLGPGQRYSHTFKSAGKKPYHCEIHPDMRASVVVKR
jgi:plastocyanin